MGRKPLDPVTQYATDVCDGKIVAARLVRLACQRHLRDLQEASRKGLEWCPRDAREACDFFPEVLCLPEETDADEDEAPADEVMPEDGTPFVLSPFQQFIVGSLFGWYVQRVSARTGATRRETRFRIAYVEVAKGSGKTPLGAGILLYMLVRHGVRGAQLFCAAVTKDQAKLAFRDAERMVQASPHLRALIDQKVNNLSVTATGSFLRPISSEKRGLDGKRVQGAVIDELHEHPSNLVVAKVRAGVKGRPNALIFIPTNSGFDRHSVCWEYHDYSRQVLEGTVTNEAWFAFVCHLDACDTCHTAGKLQPSDDCPDCDDWKTEGPHWLKANPNLGVSLPWQYLREQVREAQAITSLRNIVRRLNFCQWTEQATAWITAEQWKACEVDITLESLRGRDCFIGIDLSDKLDLSAAVLVFPRPLIRPVDPADPADADEPQRPNTVRIDYAVDVWPVMWMPKETLQLRAQQDGIPYPDWVKAGFVRATQGALVDHDVIVDTIIEFASMFRIHRIGFDAAGATAAVTRLQRYFGDDAAESAEQRKVIEIPQGFRSLSEPSKLMEALILSGNMRHNVNDAMAWCMGNMAKEENHWREIRPVKMHQRKRIDPGVALIDALKAMSLTPMSRLRQPRRPARMWTPAGFVAVPGTTTGAEHARV